MLINELNLFNQLEKLIKENDNFESKDIVIGTTIYRTYNYRLASYTDFLLPGAMEARGIMFRIGEVGNLVVNLLDVPRVVCRPFKKFFNHMENPLTIDLDLNSLVDITDKADGTMIASFLHDGEVMFKTRKTVDADQIRAVNHYLKFHPILMRTIKVFTDNNWTVIMEWTAPDNRIVLEYKEPKLILLGVRHNETGVDYTLNVFRNSDVKDYVISEIKQNGEWLDKVLPGLEDIEGCVATFKVLVDNEYEYRRVKFKTEWYKLRHGTIDIVLTPKRLFESIVNGSYDELVSINQGIPYLLEKIKKMHSLVREHYNRTDDTVTSFYKANKKLERKDYAIKGTTELDHRCFGMAMALYLGKEPDYEKALMSLWKESLSKEFAEKEYSHATGDE